ncbi:MAG TPA: pseudouridine synthase [Bacillota bacterium]|nr:pseudouridine synthase [Bacillota bacterium]
MRINKFVASRSGLSRRAADIAIERGRIAVNGQPPQPGQDITDADHVTIDGRELGNTPEVQTIILHKPVNYVVSREGQGSATIYELLPPEFRRLNPVGRLDKDSSGLLLLTNDGQLAQELTHPKYQKTKVYEIELSSPLTNQQRDHISKRGVQLPDGLSRLQLMPLDNTGRSWRVTMQEGRNRQIRRTFAELGHQVIKLHRTQFGDYTLPRTLPEGQWASTSAPSAR